jgi:hypothetical protein
MSILPCELGSQKRVEGDPRVSVARFMFKLVHASLVLSGGACQLLATLHATRVRNLGYFM